MLAVACALLITVAALFYAQPPLPLADAHVVTCAPPPPAGPAARGLPWVPIAALADANFSRHAPAPGCPPPPALCALNDVFDEVVLISLPRFPARAQRATAQLDALGARYTLVHAHDTRTVGSGAPSGFSKGEFALWLTHLGIFAYVERAPFRSVLVLEDDATFAMDFPAAFDAAARALPADWSVFHLGQSMLWLAGAPPASSPIALRDSVALDVRAFFAVALSRDAAAHLAREMVAMRIVIDMSPMGSTWARFRTLSFLAWPPLVAMDPFTGSTLGNSWLVPAATWKAHNGVAAERFDLRGPGFVAGGGAAPHADAARCFEPGAVEHRVDLFGGDIRWIDAADSSLVAAAPIDCCALCVEAFPVCVAWTHAYGRCWLKTSAAGRVAAGDSFASGVIEPSL